jgi:hypothetical protein
MAGEYVVMPRRGQVQSGPVGLDLPSLALRSGAHFVVDA